MKSLAERIEALIHGGGIPVYARVDLAAILADVREIERDAGRYRWLRDRGPAPSSLWVAMGVIGMGVSQWRGQPLDAEIDAAILSRTSETTKEST